MALAWELNGIAVGTEWHRRGNLMAQTSELNGIAVGTYWHRRRNLTAQTWELNGIGTESNGIVLKQLGQVRLGSKQLGQV